MNARKVRILLIEDDDSVGSTLQTILESENFDTSWARDGREGLKLADLIEPDVVVTDLMMPVLDGFGFMREYRSKPLKRRAPILAYSASQAYLSHALKEGASAVLTKPFSIDDLVLRVKALLESPDAAISDPVHPAHELEEKKRLEAVLSLDFDQHSATGLLDSLVKRVAHMFEMPICAVSIVRERNQVLQAVCGVTIRDESDRENPREQAFCTYAVAAHAALVVQDLAESPLFRQNPLVLQKGFRFYAGVPLVTRAGHAVGTLCLMDFKPRTFSHADLKLLEALSRRVLAEFERRELLGHPNEPRSNFQYLSLIDDETGLVGREGFADILAVQLSRAAERRSRVALAAIAVPHTELRSAIDWIMETFPNVLVGRLGFSRLGMILPDMKHIDAANQLRERGPALTLLSTLPGERYFSASKRALVELELPLGSAGLTRED